MLTILTQANKTVKPLTKTTQPSRPNNSRPSFFTALLRTLSAFAVGVPGADRMGRPVLGGP